MSQPVAILWVFLTTLFTACAFLSLLSPDWFNNEEVISSANLTSGANVSFGLLRYCKIGDFHSSLVLCNYYHGLGKIPSVMWTLCTVVYALGATLMLISVIVCLFGCMSAYATWNRLRIGLLYLQIFGVAFLMLSLIFFPIGLNSPFARDICGPDSDIFSPGECRLAWGYMLAMMDVLLMLFLPVFAKYASLGPSGYHKTDSAIEMLQMSPGGTTKRMTTV